MPGRDFAHPYVQRAMREGIGPTAGLRMARDAGLRISNGDWFRTYGSERANRAIQARAIAEPLNRRPTTDQIGKWDTRKKTGYAYRVVGVMEDRETGAIKTTLVTVITDTLITRGRAMQQAMDSFQDPDEKYPGILQAAFMAGVFQMVPLPDDEADF